MERCPHLPRHRYLLLILCASVKVKASSSFFHIDFLQEHDGGCSGQPPGRRAISGVRGLCHWNWRRTVRKCIFLSRRCCPEPQRVPTRDKMVLGGEKSSHETKRACFVRFSFQTWWSFVRRWPTWERPSLWLLWMEPSRERCLSPVDLDKRMHWRLQGQTEVHFS